jgi:hypothetical protein
MLSNVALHAFWQLCVFFVAGASVLFVALGKHSTVWPCLLGSALCLLLS